MNYIKNSKLPKEFFNFYIRISTCTYVGLLGMFYYKDNKVSKKTHWEKQKYALFGGYNWPFLAYEICQNKDVTPLSSFIPFSS